MITDERNESSARCGGQPGGQWPQRLPQLPAPAQRTRTENSGRGKLGLAPGATAVSTLNVPPASPASAGSRTHNYRTDSCRAERHRHKPAQGAHVCPWQSPRGGWGRRPGDTVPREGPRVLHRTGRGEAWRGAGERYGRREGPVERRGWRRHGKRQPVGLGTESQGTGSRQAVKTVWSLDSILAANGGLRPTLTLCMEPRLTLQGSLCEQIKRSGHGDAGPEASAG